MDFLAHLDFYSRVKWIISWVQNGCGLNLLPRLKTNAAVPLLPQYTFRKVRGTTLLSHFTWLTFFPQVIETDQDFWECSVM
jgi:hypothetical protein